MLYLVNFNINFVLELVSSIMFSLFTKMVLFIRAVFATCTSSYLSYTVILMNELNLCTNIDDEFIVKHFDELLKRFSFFLNISLK